MKFLIFALGLAAVMSAAVVACGPQQPYCKEDSTGRCFTSTADPDAGTISMPDTGIGEPVIIGGDDTGP